MRYIIRSLRFQDGEWDKEPLKLSNQTGYANWEIIEVLETHNASNGIYYLNCLIKDQTQE